MARVAFPVHVAGMLERVEHDARGAISNRVGVHDERRLVESRHRLVQETGVPQKLAVVIRPVRVGLE